MATLPLTQTDDIAAFAPESRAYRPTLVDAPADAPLIARASDDAWRARIESRLDIARRAHARTRVAAIDAMLEILETRHLAGERTFDRLTRLRLRRLERVVGLPLPRKAVRARNTVRLHAALLDWQEIVLDQVTPARRAFEDVYDNDWNAPTPDYSTAS